MKKYSLVIATLLLLVLFVRLWSNNSDQLNEIESYYANRENASSVALTPNNTNVETIARVLSTHNYVANKEDANFVANFIVSKFKEGRTLSKLSDLEKRAWQIPSSLIDSLRPATYVERLVESQKKLAIVGDELLPSVNSLSTYAVIDSKYQGEIKVVITAKNEKGGRFAKATPCKDVLVRLSEQYLDSLNHSVRSTIKYVKTNEDGVALFSGLNPKMSYSVLPIKKGFEYGSSKGTIGGDLASASRRKSLMSKIFGGDNKLVCEFNQREHRIRLFDTYTSKQIKEDYTLTVRTPKEFKRTLVMYLLLFFAAWWGLWLSARLRKRPIDNSLLSILMMLTGLCLLTMFALSDPLTDALLGVDMAQGIIAGVVIITLLQGVNITKLYQNQLGVDFDLPVECFKWLFKPFRTKVSYLTKILADKGRGILAKFAALLCVLLCLPLLILDLLKAPTLYDWVSSKLDKLPKGSGYLLMALLLTALLFTPLGTSVGGMKVNLNIGFLFQPSEIAKYLIIIFMAGYFSVNANKIVQFSEKGNSKLFGAKLKMMASIILGLGILMGLYLVLGDMGPALVLAFTFIILYSIIKSKIDLEGASDDKLRRIFTCDIAMLIYGVVTFIIFLYVGYLLDNMGLLCIAWFVIWLVVGVVKKQIHETPVFFNFIVAAFIFGGSILCHVPGLGSVAERLDSRNEMCVNTWGTLPIDGDTENAGENTQVAEGLWGLASGGFFGQGLGNGSPRFIPAFHTDMILESIGEQMGFLGIFFIILLLAILLRKTIVLGYNTYHPFTFYLCTGIAVVTAIQFIIISLGSTGIIPLTGVTVPFFSYGKVSMILNLAAFGLILSVASHAKSEAKSANSEVEELTKQNISKYNYSISLLSWAYCLLAMIISCVFLYYQVLDRGDTLVRPVYVQNSNGVPIVEYNPRIYQLMKNMRVGDIYDRNGVLLATSNPSKLEASVYKSILGSDYKLETTKYQRRYYPFGAHLAFMLGDYNSDIYTFKSGDAGYVAEWRHLAELRGFDNLKDDDGNTMPKVALYSDSYKAGKWYPKGGVYATEVQMYNYSKLIPYLKDGLSSRRLRRLNNGEERLFSFGDIKPENVKLTIDAAMQAKLQIGVEEYVKKNYKNSKWLNKIRASVVVLDAKDGDLLASANYPLPDATRIEEEMADNKLPAYSDSSKPNNWNSYSDLDMGLMYYSAPGSTAKVMSALSGLKKLGTEAAEQSYKIEKSQIVGAEPTGNVGMREAIVVSSNCYFINLVNEHNLYNDLLSIYESVGTRIGYVRPYGLFYSDSTKYNKFQNIYADYRVDESLAKYRRYVDNKETKKMNDPVWQWAWGQGELSATPVSMARVASIVANGGKMAATRYTTKDKTNSVEILSSD